MQVDATKRTPGLIIERTYRARVSEVWDLWTTKDGFESWWGPQGFRVEVRELDARVGGTLRYEMIADSLEMVAAMKQLGQPTSHPVRSTFSELVRHERLVLTNAIDFLPGVTPYESHIAAEFFTVGDHVRMVLTLDRLHDAEWTKQQQDGMTSQLTKLETRFSAA